MHPQSPAPTVREAVYRGFGKSTAASARGIGWHYETGVQIVRLMLAGVSIGSGICKWSPGIGARLCCSIWSGSKELAGFAKLERPVLAYFRSNVSVTPSGMWSPRYLR